MVILKNIRPALFLLLSIAHILPLHGSYHHNLITPQGNPTQTLLILLEDFNITHDGSLASIVQATQKEQPVGFLRARGKERWETVSDHYEYTELVTKHATALGALNAIYPEQQTYDYVFLLGATVNTVRNRLAFLLGLWHQGIRWKHLVMLTGERPLDPVLESHEQLFNENNGFISFKKDWHLKKEPTTEKEMMEMVLEQSDLPDQWHTIPCIIVNSPLKENGARPTTDDTIISWLETKPQPGTILAISNQPYIGYQDALIDRLLPENFKLETVGRGTKNTPPETILDSIARWLYSLHRLFE